MEVYTLKQISEELGVTYEAVRQQVIRYSDDLKGHITKQGKKQFIDEWGVDFLRAKRREYHVVVEDTKETVDSLKAEIDSLRESLLKAQKELLTTQTRVITLQEEVREGLEAKLQYQTLLEDSRRKDEQIDAIRGERDAIIQERDSQQEQIFSLKAESESQRATIDDLKAERDAALEESQSYHKTWFGFYRKD